MRPVGSLNELNERVIERLQRYDMEEPVTSVRSLQRDLQALRRLGIDVGYSRIRGLHITDDEGCGHVETILETFDILNILNADTSLNTIVFPEHRPSRGTEFLYPLVRAIQGKREVRFRYKKYGDLLSKVRTIHPYALKEVLNRWYLLGMKEGQDWLIAFGLDRMSDLETLESVFVPRPVDIAAHYRDCFGIFKDEKQKAEEVILSFNETDGRYVDSQPIHPSQEDISGEAYPGRYAIRLHIRVTDDFILHLLSRGHSLEVHSPRWLRERIRDIYREGAGINSMDPAPEEQ